MSCDCGCNGRTPGCAAGVVGDDAMGGGLFGVEAARAEDAPRAMIVCAVRGRGASSRTFAPPPPATPDAGNALGGWSSSLAQSMAAPAASGYGRSYVPSAGDPPPPPPPHTGPPTGGGGGGGSGTPGSTPGALDGLGIDGETFRRLPTDAQVSIIQSAIAAPEARQRAINDLVLGSIDRVITLINSLGTRDLERFREETRRISQQYDFLLRREQAFYDAWLRAQGVPPSTYVPPTGVPIYQAPPPQGMSPGMVMGGVAVLAAVAGIAYLAVR